MNEDILIVDDEADIRALIAGLLEDEGYQPIGAANDKEAMAALAARQPSLIILDVWLTGSEMDGLQILNKIRQDYPDSQVIMISGHATIEVALKALRMGAYDFITKPFKSAELFHIVNRALSEARLRKENQQLQIMSGYGGKSRELIGSSEAIQNIKRQITKIAEGTSRILIQGAKGSGKTLVAKILHDQSSRAKGQFINFNCGAYSLETIESNLFGMEARVGHPRKIGAIEQAHGGTLFLDEIQILPANLQQKLLKFLQRPLFLRMGGTQEIEVDVRLIASSAMDLEQKAKAGEFSSDLLNRMSVHRLQLPDFAERLDDLPELANEMIKRACLIKGRRQLRLSGGAQAQLMNYTWPGNGWELSRIIDLVIEALPSDQMVIDEIRWKEAMQGNHQKPSQNATHEIFDFEATLSLSLKDARDLFEKEYIRRNLLKHQNNISRTAQLIGMDRAALHRKMKLLNLQEGSE